MTDTPPFHLLESATPQAPLIVDSPHSGRDYPKELLAHCTLDRLRQSEDCFVDELAVTALPAGASVLAANFPRSLIDVNRAEDDVDPTDLAGVWPHAAHPTTMTRAGFGLIRRVARDGTPLYRAPLAAMEVQARIETFYRPYHAALRGLVAARRAQFGDCLLVDLHSMPDQADAAFGRADFILGDRDGTSCDPALTRAVQRMLQNLGYRVTLNAPYKGREIVRRYGVTGLGAQALQIEINRKLYLDEAVLEKTVGFAGLQRDMAEFFRVLAEYMSDRIAALSDRLAAE